MPKFNFSKEEFKIYDLAKDLARDNFSVHVDSNKVSKEDLQDYLRSEIKDKLLDGQNINLFQAYRRNKVTLFEIFEEVLNVVIGEDVLNSPFIDAFVEVKNRHLGDTTSWYSEGGLLTVASFAGNHWDTNRQALDLGQDFTLPKEWIYIHVYDEFERFLLGIVSIDKLMDKVYKSINKYIQDRLYIQFQNVASSVPLDFVRNGNNEEKLGELCDVVQAAGGYDSLTLAGTKGALRRVANIVPDKMFANSMKEAKASSGAIASWEGNSLMVIPQTLKSGTFTLALNDKQVFVMGGDVKPIKLEFIGDTRTMEADRTGKSNNDMTVDLQIQTLLGMGMILPPYFGVFNFD